MLAIPAGTGAGHAGPRTAGQQPENNGKTPMPPVTSVLVAALLALGAAWPSPAAGATDYTNSLVQRGYARVPVRWLPTGHLMVLAEVNGIPGRFLLDTGAARTVLNAASVARFGLAPCDCPAVAPTAVGAGGPTGLSAWSVERFELAGVRARIDHVRAADLSAVVAAIREAARVEIDGIIGQDLLVERQGVIDLAAGRLFLLASRPPRGNTPMP